MSNIGEADWKIFKQLRERALERFCTAVLDEIAAISADEAKSKHERYLRVCRLMRDRDREIDPIFDSLRRSTAVQQLCAFRSRDLLTPDELDLLSPQLRESIERRVRIWNEPIDVVDEDDDGGQAPR